jgi:hypothetical protein
MPSSSPRVPSASRPTGATTTQLSLFDSPLFEPFELTLSLDQDVAHTSTTITVAPDGGVVVSRCACGGRSEVLIAHAVIASAMDSAADDSPEVVVQGLSGLARRLSSGWRESHRQCATVPRRHVFPPALQRLSESVWQMAVETIVADEAVADVLYLLTSNGVVVVPLEESWRVICAQANLARGDKLAHGLVKAAIRTTIREMRLDVIGAVVVAEAWIASAESSTGRPSDRPEREEAVDDVRAVFHFRRDQCWAHRSSWRPGGYLEPGGCRRSAHSHRFRHGRRHLGRHGTKPI